MDKGWGLTLDSAFSTSLGFFPSSKLPPPRPGLGFPLNLSRTMESSDGVVDFFSDRNKLSAQTADKDHPDVKPHISINQENSQIQPVAKSNLDINIDLQLLTGNAGSDRSTVDDGISSDGKHKQVPELAQLEEELLRMNAENQKLKEILSHVSSNYTALQMQLSAIMQQRQNQLAQIKEHDDQVVEGKAEEKKQVPRQFLEVGASGEAEVDEVSNSFSEDRTLSSSPPNNNIEVGSRNYVKNNGKSHEMGGEERPESESQGWGPNKLQKLNPSNSTTDQSTTEPNMKKARVAVRARSEAPMISDGCQWRKYGQKMAKGNPCPRAYYRCTMALGCPVRKQVQRCAEDRTILITTYEGSHNHPLPPAAMAMASTTTAAVSMLLSGPMSSGDHGVMMNPNLAARAILPACSSSMATLSASAPFPTVTLDLTHNNANPLMQFQRPPPSDAPFQVPYSGQPQNFGPQAFAQALYNQSKFSGLQLSADTVSTATAAITADPNFTAALAAAISSIIGGAHPDNNNKHSSSSNPNIINSCTISSFSGN